MNDTNTANDMLAEAARTHAPHEAVLEASRCLMCDDAPCNRGCPADVDVRRFIRKIRFGNFLGASRLIREANLLVGICGRLCPQEILCMEHCTRAKLDSPIDIAGLQRFAGDVELRNGANVWRSWAADLRGSRQRPSSGRVAIRSTCSSGRRRSGACSP